MNNESTYPASVLGMGIDLVETDRLEKMLERWGDHFKQKVFRDEERSYCDGKAEPWRHYAGRFAVKEAVSKAFGTGIGEHIDWLDIEVRRNHETGAPSVRLSDKAQALAEHRGIREIMVSISHTRHYAVAQAILIGTP